MTKDMPNAQEQIHTA